MEEFDLVIIGGGVGGLVTASGASQMGAKVALIEKESLGGDCLHWGCVPTKRLVQVAKLASLFRRSEEYGIDKENFRVNFQKVMNEMRSVQAGIGKNDDPERFRKMGVEVIFGEGKFLSPRVFEVNGRELYGKRFLIATGSRSVVIPLAGLPEANPLTHVSALQLRDLPKSMVILGAGPIGIEFAQVFSRLGTRVTVVEKVGQILPREDKEVADALEEILKKEGIDIVTCMDVKEVRRIEGGKRFVTGRCEIHGDLNLEIDEIMISVGRAPNVEGLGLEIAGVVYGPKGIQIDATMRTSQKHIFAAGDVTGLYPFTHMAEYQAGIVVSNALFPFVNRNADYRVVPWVTYADPELARVGLTQEEAKGVYGEKNIQVFRFEFKDVDRAVVEGEGHGFLKLICDKKNRIVGAHLLGSHAGELLPELVLAMKARIPITQISQTIHVYPTLAQGVKRVCDQFYRQKLFSGWFPRFSRFLVSLLR